MWKNSTCNQFLNPQLKISTMKVASSNNLNFSPIIPKRTPTPSFPPTFAKTHFLKLPQRSPNNAFLKSSPIPFNYYSFLSISSSSFHTVHKSNTNEGSLTWNEAPNIVTNGGFKGVGSNDKVVTVVLLGWLGARSKHLKRYVEWYNLRGIHAVTFVVDVKELIRFDPVARLEQRMVELGNVLLKWVTEKEDDGRERCLIFHTFSNTGWLVYGSLLDRFKRKEGFKEKIRGTIIDSGSGDPLNPKVWAAGFAAAILKKRNTSVNESENASTNLKLQDDEHGIIEAILLAALEKFFYFVLNMPNSRRRLRRIITAIMEHPAPCPQLYLYSTADKIIPYKSVELSMAEMREKGIKVFYFNFGTSPHVDHFRTFPDKYSSELQNFLKECFSAIKQT